MLVRIANEVPPMTGEVIEPRSTGGGLVPTRHNRELARVSRSARVQAQKVRGVHYVGGVGMQAAALLTMQQSGLKDMVPDSELRVAAIADAATTVIQMLVLQIALEE
jgi:hypothetical protein